MNWKEFIQPTKLKIALVIIFLAAGICTYYLTFYYYIYWGGQGIYARIIDALVITLFPHAFVIASITRWSAIYELAQLFWHINIIIGIFYWYLLACLIVFIRSKLKRPLKDQASLLNHTRLF
jgi:hypothetical protein